ncbi:hypothetical protein QBC47DRAFT_395434 [Echria macrotheca]|uniref:Uncharacterized protein n=1 Tax=Echria macrotheca TaxID=438768 RepID=A0AAJ0F1C4_9PEZI|nr:hypothetical protein QBC47DRAFT_395434 [Echria macrotheca]
MPGPGRAWRYPDRRSGIGCLRLRLRQQLSTSSSASDHCMSRDGAKAAKVDCTCFRLCNAQSAPCLPRFFTCHLRRLPLPKTELVDIEEEKLSRTAVMPTTQGSVLRGPRPLPDDPFQNPQQPSSRLTSVCLPHGPDIFTLAVVLNGSGLSTSVRKPVLSISQIGRLGHPLQGRFPIGCDGSRERGEGRIGPVWLRGWRGPSCGRLSQSAGAG